MRWLAQLEHFWPHFVAGFDLAAVLLASGHALLHKREPRAATLWIGVIWLLPALEVVFVDRALHQRAVAAWTVARRRGLSLVDCAGFELMRDLGVVTALAFDRHFEEQGFATP